MKLSVIKCPNCGADIEQSIKFLKEHEFVFCAACGRKIEIENEVDIEVIKENHKFELQKQKMKDKKQDKIRYWAMLVVMFILSMSGLFGITVYEDWKEEKEIKANMEQGKIPIGLSSSELKGENYKVVVTKIQSLGFENIELIELDDASVFHKEDTVDSVSIDNNDNFVSKDCFDPSSLVIISYH